MTLPPRLSEVFCRWARQAVKVGSINAQRASERSLRYDLRCCEEVMGILMHEVPNRAYRSIGRGKSQPKGRIRTGQKLSVATGEKRKIRHASVEGTCRSFHLYKANPGANQLSQTDT